MHNSDDATRAAFERELAGTPYRFVRYLARGGMGDVLVVVHAGLSEERVLKLLRVELAQTPEVATRLRTEARVLSRLSHPNLVRVLDFGLTQTGRPFLVTELLRGETLKEWVQQHGAMPVQQALEVARSTLLGLEQAHAEGIVHRDLKLENLFYVEGEAPAKSRSVKVLDFGAAKILAPEVRTAVDQAPTREGMLIGTPRFLSPEQALGNEVGVRADLYSLGVVLYWLVTGRPVFSGTTEIELLKAHAFAAPTPPSQVAPQTINAALERLILCALEKRPERRFQTAAHMRREIEALLLEGLPSVQQKPAAVAIADSAFDRPSVDSDNGTRHLASVLQPDEGSANGTRHTLPLPTRALPTGAPPTRAEPPRHAAKRGSAPSKSRTMPGWLLVVIALLVFVVAALLGALCRGVESSTAAQPVGYASGTR